MKTSSIIMLSIVVFLLACVVDIPFSLRSNNITSVNSKVEMQNENKQSSMNVLPQNPNVILPSSNVAVSNILIRNPAITAIYSASYDGQTYYASSTGLVGSGGSIYDSTGVKITDCPVLPNRPLICTYHFTDMTLIWKR